MVLNKSDYDEKVNNLLKNNNIFECLKRNLSRQYKKLVVAILQQLKRVRYINKSTFYDLYPGEDIPAYNDLPKIHKTEVPLRPIVSSINSIPY